MAFRKALRRYRGWVAVGSIALIALAVFAVTNRNRPLAATPTYTTETASKGTLSVTVDGTGYLAVRDEVDAYPPASGEIAAIEVKEGERVKEGDVLYTLDDDAVQEQISQAKSSRQQAKQSLSKAELELYQAKASLSKLKAQSEMPSSTVTSSDITVAERQVTIAKSGVSAASDAYSTAAAAYTDAKAMLSELEVTAPCDGVVWSITADEGDSVGTGSTASSGSSSGSTGSSTSASGSSGSATSASASAPVTVARDGLFGVELSVNEVDVTAIETGQDVEVAFDAVSDLKMTGTVDEVAKTGTVSSGVVTYSVWLTLDGNDKRLKPGMSATATIVTLVERNVLLVSNSAVKSAEDGSSYVEVMSDGAASPQRVTVTTGATSATQTVIESGIDEGALIVTKTVTADTGESASSSGETRGEGAGILMMGAGGPPAGGPGGQ